MSDHLRFIEEREIPALREFARPIWSDTFYPLMDTRSADYIFDSWVSVEHLSEMMSQGFKLGYIGEDGEDAGWFAFNIESGGWLLISKLYLRPEFQHRGLGSRTLAEIMDYARGQGADYAYLYVFRGNEKAQAVYVRNGFRELRREFEQIAEGVVRDDVVFGRDL